MRTKNRTVVGPSSSSREILLFSDVRLQPHDEKPFADATAFNTKVKVLFLGIGSAEGPGTKSFSETLTNTGVRNVYFESSGTAHEWLTWRRALNDFAPRLFK